MAVKNILSVADYWNLDNPPWRPASGVLRSVEFDWVNGKPPILKDFSNLNAVQATFKDADSCNRILDGCGGRTAKKVYVFDSDGNLVVEFGSV